MKSTRIPKTVPAINRVAVTEDTLTGRAGLSLFVRYLANIDLEPLLAGLFGTLRKSSKGQPTTEVFKQLFLFLVDGTKRYLSYFDALKNDAGYAAILESEPARLLSSHAVKRFFNTFSLPKVKLFSRLMRELFLWHLRRAQPDLILLGLDSMVMDNDLAKKRHGVQPTYKKIKGFQPLQLTWGRHIIDAVFRRGDRHCNHGQDAKRLIRETVAAIRSHYRAEISIVVRMDSGFFDQELFALCEQLGIGYVCGGRLLDPIKARAAACPEPAWQLLEGKPQLWRYFEFGHCCLSWKRFRRAIFCQPMEENRQGLLEFARPDTVIYTNLGRGERIDQLLCNQGHEGLLEAGKILGLYHQRGADELIHRALKDFASETLPFQHFGPNMAYYFVTLVAFFLYESFKEDVCGDVVGLHSYPTTVRRQIFDQAGKIVRHAGEIVLKVTQAVWKQLSLPVLWLRSHEPPPIRPVILVAATQNRSI